MSDYFHRAADETHTRVDNVQTPAVRAGGGHADGRVAFTVGSLSDEQHPAARHAATTPEHDATSHPHG